MITNTFRRISPGFKHDRRILIQNLFFVDACRNNASYRNKQTRSPLNNKYFSCNFLNKHRFSKIQGSNLSTSACTSVLQKSSQYKNNSIFAQTNFIGRSYVVTGSVRQYSSSTDPIDDYIARITAEVKSTDPFANYGFLNSLSQSSFVEYIQHTLTMAHTYTGLPWWTTIILAAFVSKVFISLPLSVYQHRVIAKIENLKPEMEEINRRLEMEAMYAVQTLQCRPSQAKSISNAARVKEWRKLIVRDNCHPLKAVILVLVQVPVWVSFSLALRNMCYMLPIPNLDSYNIRLELTTGGFGWISNLTAVDPFYILPVLMGLINFTTIEIVYTLRSKLPWKLGKFIHNLLRVLTIVIIPFTAYMPSGLLLFWFSSSAYALAQTLLLYSPKFRRLGRVPKTESELQHPYKELQIRLNDRFPFRGKTESSDKH